MDYVISYVKKRVKKLKSRIKNTKREISYLKEKNNFLKILKFFRLTVFDSLTVTINVLATIYLIISWHPIFVFFFLCEIGPLKDIRNRYFMLKEEDVNLLEEELRQMMENKETLEKMFLNKEDDKAKVLDETLETIDMKTVLDSRATLGQKVVTIEEIDKQIDENLAHELRGTEVPQQEQIFGFEESGAPAVDKGAVRTRRREKCER